MSYYRQQLETYLKTLTIEADKVYDVGGKELSVAGRVREWNVEKYVVLDLPDFDLNKDVFAADADIVFCLEVFEYIYRPIDAVLALYALLKKHGTLYATFPFIYPYHKPLQMDYLRYTRSGVLKLLHVGGFRDIELVERVHKNPAVLKNMYVQDGMHVGGDAGVTGFIVKATKR